MGAATTLIADVDCTAAGKPLCDKVGVRGFPTIKWGDANNLEDYSGGRDFSALEKFAEKNLKPLCSPANIDLCEADDKKKIEELMALPKADLKKKIAAKEKEMEEAEETFKSEVEKLQARYEELQKDKDATISAVKDSGLGLMKSVQAHAAKKDEL